MNRWAHGVRVGVGVLLCWAGTVAAATRYDADGVPTAEEEVQRWYVNRARFAPEQEADGWGLTNTTAGGHPSYDVCEDRDGTNDFGTTASEWIPWTRSLQPLAPNGRLITAARTHGQDLWETRTVQHDSPSGNYYPIGAWPDERMTLEGYIWSVSGECIAYGDAGTSTGYVAWGLAPATGHRNLFVDTGVIDRGHRQSMLTGAFREIGIGHVQGREFVDPFYMTYDRYVQDYGVTGEDHFFTGTLFQDSNANGLYDLGEGVSNIEVRLFQNAVEGTWYDVSSTCGSFAIPLGDFIDGQWVIVRLVNKSGSSRTLRIPTGFSTGDAFTLTNNQSRDYKAFVQPTGATNVGFRGLYPLPSYAIQSSLDGNGTISPVGTIMVTHGSNRTFTISARTYHHIDDVTVDSVSVGAVSAYTFTNVMATHTIRAFFGEDRDTNGVALWWLASYGLTNFANASWGNPDGDEFYTWAEYIAGTNPTNGNSYLEMVQSEPVGSGCEVRWNATTNGGRAYPAEVFRCTNLQQGVWVRITSGLPRQVSSVQVWVDESAPSPAFYRVKFPVP